MIKIKWLYPHASKAHKRKNKLHTLSKREALKIERWIEDKRWLQDSSLQQAADDAGVSKKQMSSYFRIVFGKSFPQWRTEARIGEAKYLLLKDKDTPAAIIGEAVGISDKSNFRCLFRKVTGMTPLQWRLKHKPHVRLH